MHNALTIAVLVSLAPCKASITNDRYCLDLEPTVDFDADGILGMYFVEEIVLHRRKDTGTERDSYCYRVHIRKPADILLDASSVDRATAMSSMYYPTSTSPYEYGPRVGPDAMLPEQRYRHLVLEWDEPGNVLDYHVKFNMSRRGFWISSAPDNGGYLPDMYKHFAGTVQVLKAVSNHLVLTFCQRLPEPKLFTVVLSRQQRQLDQGEIIGIHNLLSLKRLPTSLVRKVCSGGSALAVAASTVALALFSHALAQRA